MKHLIGAVILFVFICALCLLPELILRRCCLELSSMLDETNCIAEAGALCAKADEFDPLLKIVLSHEYVNKITELSEAVEAAYIYSGVAEREKAALRSLLEELPETLRFSWQNIL